MAKPKDEEEQKIYEELIEKYKDDKRAMILIRVHYNNSSMQEDWQTTKEMLEWIIGY